MGFLVFQHGQLGAIPPPPFLSVSPLEYKRSRGAIPPPQKGYLSDTSAIPYENKANGCDTPLCDTISKGYCAIWGGISHWAAKVTIQTWESVALTQVPEQPKCPKVLSENAKGHLGSSSRGGPKTHCFGVSSWSPFLKSIRAFSCWPVFTRPFFLFAPFAGHPSCSPFLGTLLPRPK